MVRAFMADTRALAEKAARVDEAEVACAELRARLENLVENAAAADSSGGEEGLEILLSVVRGPVTTLLARSDIGKGWVSPEEIEALIVEFEGLGTKATVSMGKTKTSGGVALNGGASVAYALIVSKLRALKNK
ncbi:MAG TPA: hypothetical protein VJG48_02480 [Candidatus Paceibacterota bacterium]